MSKQLFVKILVYGLLQWIVLNVVLFVITLILGMSQKTEMSEPTSLGFALLAVIMVGVSSIGVRRMKVVNRSQAVMVGLVWSGMTLVFMVVLTIANGTQSVVFGNWGSYTVFVSQLVGAAMVKLRPAI